MEPAGKSSRNLVLSDFTISFRSMCESDIPTACDKAAIFLFNRSASIKFGACDIFYLGG